MLVESLSNDGFLTCGREGAWTVYTISHPEIYAVCERIFRSAEKGRAQEAGPRTPEASKLIF